ncbi:Hypothetical predicted protein, partial [Marmota monax]
NCHSENMPLIWSRLPAGPPVDVGMRIDVASIDMVSEVNMHTHPVAPGFVFSTHTGYCGVPEETCSALFWEGRVTIAPADWLGRSLSFTLAGFPGEWRCGGHHLLATRQPALGPPDWWSASLLLARHHSHSPIRLLAQTHGDSTTVHTVVVSECCLPPSGSSTP